MLAGGRGTRLGLTDLPKPMVPVAGKPLLQRQVEMAKRQGFREFLFLTNHLADRIESHFGDGSQLDVRIDYVSEPTARGTAGAVKDAGSYLDESFVLLYGDILLDVDLADLVDHHHREKAIATLLVHPNNHPADSDLVLADDDGIVRGIRSKPHPEGALLPNLVNAAVHVLDRRALDYVPETGAPDWGRDVFARMVAAGERMVAHRSSEYAKDVGTPSRLQQAEIDVRSGRLERLSRRKPRPAVFLDRDGVLNEEVNGVHKPGDLKLLAGSARAVRRINEAGFPAICVTNQPDVAKGFLSLDDLTQVSAALDTRLAEEGAYLDDLFFCPHHPEVGWPGEVADLKIECDCRKPRPGLILHASKVHNLDLSRSWIVGDREVDVVAGHEAGTRAVLVTNGSLSAEPRSSADHVADDLDAAVTHILERMTTA